MTPDPLLCALFITIAFVLAGFLHSAWLRSRLSRRLLLPIDGGVRVRGRRVFGENKTVRGFVVMVPAAAAMFVTLFEVIANVAPGVASALWPLTPGGYFALGAWAGLGFMLGELPNSFAKRQLDVSPGEPPRNRAAASVSFVVDRIDSILGALVAITLVVPTSWLTWAYVLAIGPTIHWSFSFLLYRLGVKARAA